MQLRCPDENGLNAALLSVENWGAPSQRSGRNESGSEKLDGLWNIGYGATATDVYGTVLLVLYLQEQL